MIGPGVEVQQAPFWIWAAMFVVVAAGAAVFWFLLRDQLGRLPRFLRILMALGVVYVVVSPLPGLLLAAGLEPLASVLWVAGLALTIAGMVVAWRHWRREAKRT